MDIQQLTDIQFFYQQFLLQVRCIRFSNAFRSEKEKKAELIGWLIGEKKQRRFSQRCRQEIAYTLDEVNKNALSDLDSKIVNLERNCALIVLELKAGQHRADAGCSSLNRAKT